MVIRPETATIAVGDTEAPFAVDDLPAGEDVELRIFVDKYVVEVFANDRQAVVAACEEYDKANQLVGYTFGASTKIREVKIWRLKATNQGFLDAKESRIWVPEA